MQSYIGNGAGGSASNAKSCWWSWPTNTSMCHTHEVRLIIVGSGCTPGFLIDAQNLCLGSTIQPQSQQWTAKPELWEERVLDVGHSCLSQNQEVWLWVRKTSVITFGHASPSCQSHETFMWCTLLRDSYIYIYLT